MKAGMYLGSIILSEISGEKCRETPKQALNSKPNSPIPENDRNFKGTIFEYLNNPSKNAFFPGKGMALGVYPSIAMTILPHFWGEVIEGKWRGKSML